MRARYDTKLLPEGGRAAGYGVDGATITVEAELTDASTVCPTCGGRSGRRHGRYVRYLADLPAHGRAVGVRLSPVRRFRCMTTRCSTRTFSEGDRLDAPWVIDGAMNGQMFEFSVETQLAPTLRPGDVVILDNLSSHKSPGAAKAMRDIGAWFLFLPPYSPDLNPIEMAFSKLKALIRKAAARTYPELWKAVGHVCDLFSEEECYNFFKAAGYKTDETRHALASSWCIIFLEAGQSGLLWLEASREN